MKQETIQKGAELLKEIEQVQAISSIFGLTDEIHLRISTTGKWGSIYPHAPKCYLDKTNTLPEELLNQITEEFVRAIQRAKKHCATWENKFKQELEDLAE